MTGLDATLYAMYTECTGEGGLLLSTLGDSLFAPTGSQDSFLVDGELTIRGVTRPIILTVEVNGFGPDPYGGTRAGFSAQGEIDRTEFGITFNAPVPGSGGVMVSERIQIEIEAEAVLRQQQG